MSDYLENIFELDDIDEEHLQRDTNQVFREFLDPNNKGYVTRDDIKALSQESLKEIARRTEAPHGPIAWEPGNEEGANRQDYERGNMQKDEL